MEALTPSDLLQSLPGLLYTWSLIVLGWGVIAGAMFYKLHKSLGVCDRTTMRESDKYTLWVVAAVNVLLTWYLFTHTAQTGCTSWITVVNVFYTAHLSYVSLDVARWWKTIKQRCGHNTPTVHSS